MGGPRSALRKCEMFLVVVRRKIVEVFRQALRRAGAGRAELHHFPNSHSVPGGYAILSHTWSHSGEQTFQEIQVNAAVCKGTTHNPRDRVSPKIRDCCLTAERDGHRWVWIDTCCINKESSTELSEAINSMFSWYVLSEVCYAYLEDVPSGDNPQAEDSLFRQARWHTRGWTLQELLAPAFVVFMSSDWKRIGTKNDLGNVLADRTGIAEVYLTRERSFFASSIGERMKWACDRQTSRVEDEAYCLLGLFNISIPIVYGEGRQAFQHLQQELARRQYVDTTLFAWGVYHDVECSKLPVENLAKIYSGFHHINHYERFLFASSPRDFATGMVTFYTPSRSPTEVLQPYLPNQWSDDVRQGNLLMCISY